MKINFVQEIQKLEGGVLVIKQEGEPDKPMLLRMACVNALMGLYEDEKNLSGEEKVKRYDMATKIQAMSEVDFTTEEIATIKKLVAKSYSPLVVGQAWKMLEGK